jgi:hypothetical protein
MTSIFEIENLIIEKLSNIRHKGRTTKYEALVKSAIKLNANGCDGKIIMEAESMIKAALTELAIEDLIAIYNDTEVGQTESAQGFEPDCRESMIQDVTVELLQRIAEAICSEAEKGMKRK